MAGQPVYVALMRIGVGFWPVAQQEAAFAQLTLDCVDGANDALVVPGQEPDAGQQ